MTARARQAMPAKTEEYVYGAAQVDKETDSSMADNTGNELPGRWKEVQSAIWLIGIAIIAINGWWWPGMLVLAGISGLTQAFIGMYVDKQDEEKRVIHEQRIVETQRAEALPEQCPICGGPLSASSVIWRSATTASCPYCNTSIKATRPAAAQPQNKS